MYERFLTITANRVAYAPLRTVRATFTAYGSGTLKANPVTGTPAVELNLR